VNRFGMCQGCRSRYLAIGGALGGRALSLRADAGHVKGR
jgi:hypothetical protein